jgi:hypothetical protein
MQEIKDYLAEYNTTKPVSRATKFLWWCAGADRQILLQCPMADRVKYGGIGGIVFCTGLLAAFSGGYAFYTIFSPKGDAVNLDPIDMASVIGSALFAIIWGLIILNMDRFIVSSTGKGDGTDAITRKEFVQALPRIIIAIILGFAISSPLEVRILKTEINAELQNKQDDYLMTLNIKTDSITNLQMKNKKTDLSKVENEIKGIEQNFEKQRIEILDGRKRLEDEIAGRIGSGKAGEGPAAKAQKENLNKQEIELQDKKKAKESEITALKDRYARINNEVDLLDKGRDEKYKKNQLIAHQLDGLMERIHISHAIGGVVPWLIFLVLLCIEAGPIFFKMMMNKGVYEYLVDNNKERFKAHSGVVVIDQLVHGKDGANHAERIDYLEVEKEIEAKKMQLEKQSDLTSVIIDKWHTKKKDDINTNPESYYTED